MKFYIFFAIIILANFSWVQSQDNDASNTKKPKPQPKSLELLKLMEDESDVLFKDSQLGNKRVEDYLANIKNISGVEKGEFSLLKISSEFVRIYSHINSRIYKNNLKTDQEVKKIADVFEDSNNNNERFVGVNNGNHLLLLNHSKKAEKISISIEKQSYNLNEIARDENWNFALYEWEKKPVKGVFVTTIETASPLGSIIYKVGLSGNISPCLVSLENMFSYKSKSYKIFQTTGLETLSDGDYFFNEKGSLVGVAYELKGKIIILDGYFISVVCNEMFESSGGESNLGLIGSFTEKGFLVNGVINQDNKVLKKDLIQEIDKVKISKENIYSIKQSLKRKKTIEVKILRGERQETLKCSTIKEINFSNFKALDDLDNKIALWIDPTDNSQLAEVIKFLTICEPIQFNNFEIKFYRIKEDSLLHWFGTVKLLRYLLANRKKNDVLEWFLKNPYQDSDEFFSKFSLNFSLTQSQYAEILGDKNEEDSIMKDYTNGMLKHKIKALPALSFSESEGVPKTQEIVLWIREFLIANSL